MTPEQKGSLPLRLEKLFYELQDRVFTDIVRRIKKTGEITSTADYQINKLLILGNSTEFIESEIKRLIGLAQPQRFGNCMIKWLIGNMFAMRRLMSRLTDISHRWKRMSRFNSGHKLLSIKPKMK